LFIMMIPIFFQPDYWTNLAGRTIFFNWNSNLTLTSVFELSKHMANNLLYASYAYLFIPVESHYIVSSYVDPLFAVFLPLGFLLSILNFSRNQFLAFLTISFVLELLLMSISNPYDAPSTTRMFLFIPFYYVFGVIGLDWLVKVIARTTYQPGRFYYWIITCVMILASILNLIQSTLVLDKRTERYPIQSIILRLFQYDAITNPEDYKTYLFLTEKDFGFYFFETFVDVYHVPDSKAQLQQLIIESPQISENWLQRIEEQEDLIIIVPYSLPSSLFTSLQPILEQTGKTACEVTDNSGNFHYYQMWYSQKYSNMCSEAQSQY